MAHEITVPRLGWSMEEGTFLGWLKQEGDAVREGEPLFTLESEKAAQDVEATESGILRIAPDAPARGSTVLVGVRLGFLAAEGEEVSFATNDPVVVDEDTGDRIGDADATAPAPLPVSTPPPVQSHSAGTVTISPRAARAAAALGVDWRQLRGTGKTGRIRERDVLAAPRDSTPRATSALRETTPKPAEPAVAGRVIPISATRRTIARRMSAGAHEAAPVSITTRADASKLVAARERLKGAAASSGVPAPTFNDLIVKLTAAALQEHPMLMAQWREETIFIPDEINLAIGIDTDAGLLVAVLRNVPGLSVSEVASAARSLIEQARAGRLGAEQFQGGSFTVTNLGSIGIDAFTPIINLPQSAILGVGRITREPVVVGEKVVARDMIALSLTFDHRIIDGAPAARFLATLTKLLAEPGTLLD